MSSLRVVGAMSQRQERVAELVREIISSFMLKRQTVSPMLDGMVNITRVWVSPDIRNATVFFNLLDPSRNPADVEEAFFTENRIFAKALAREITTKFTPRLKFVYDTGLGEITRIDELLDTVAKDLSAEVIEEAQK